MTHHLATIHTVQTTDIQTTDGQNIVV